MALDNFNKDPNRPAEYVDSAYEALKFNPQATQQVLQQGQNAGLAGLGAMAANRYQQRTQLEQKGQQAQQMAQQPPPPTVLDQQLQAMMQQGGIMGQLPNNIQMAQASPQAPQGGAGLGDLPVDPNTLPQEMAGGGLVALAQGGYLDGYADGGQVRGFATGTSEMLRAMDIPDAADYFQLGEDLTDADRKLLQELMEEDDGRYRDRMIRKGMAGEGVPESTLQRRAGMYSPEVPETPASYKDIYGKAPAETYGSRPTYADKYGVPGQAASEYSPYRANVPEAPVAKPSMIEGMSQSAHAPTHPMAEAMAKSGKAPFKGAMNQAAKRTLKGTLGHLGGAAGTLANLGLTASMLDDVWEDPANAESRAKWEERLAKLTGGAGEKPPHKNAPEGEAAKAAPEFEKAKQAGNHLAILNEPVVQEPMLGEGATRLVQQEAMRSPERPPATPEMAERNIEQGRSMLPANEGGIPAARPQLTSGESYGVPSSMGAGNIKEQLAMIKALRGGAPSRPAGEADRYAQMLEDANTQKWLQTLTGAVTGVLAGGGKNWGQAIGLGAQYGMNAYNRGAEEEGKLELGMVERAAQEQEAERKFSEASADKLLGIMQDTAKLGSTADTARMKAIQDARIEAEKAYIRQSEGALNRAAHKENALIGAGGRGQSDYYNRLADAHAEVERRIEALRKEATYVDDAGKAKIRDDVYAEYGLTGNTSNSLGGGQGLGGGRPLGRITSAGGFQ